MRLQAQTCLFVFVLNVLSNVGAQASQASLRGVPDCTNVTKLCDAAAKLTLVSTIKSKLPRGKATVTVAAPFSLERLKPLEVQCSLHKDSPYVVFAAAIYVPVYQNKIFSRSDDVLKNSDVLDIVSQMQKFHEEQTAKGCILDLALWQENLPDIDIWYTYPNNALRNKAMLLVETEVVALIDADFVLGPTSFGSNFHPGIPMYEAAMGVLRNKSVLVMPAFDLTIDAKMPDEVTHGISKATEHKEQLLSMDKIQPFQQRFHYNTDYDRWRTSTTMYDVSSFKLASETFHIGYEPYILALKKGLPCYDERFRGYFFNKQEFLYHIHRLGYTYVVHPDVYVIHLPHPKVPTLSVEINGEPRALKQHMAAKVIWEMDAKGEFVPFVRDASCDMYFD